MQKELSDPERQQLLTLFHLDQAPPRIHVLSDLHLERGDYRLPAGLEFDVLVAAGDIGTVEQGVNWLSKVGKPVVYVLGNHERYGEDVTEAVAKAKALAAGTQVHVLERDSVVLHGVRFLGATLWTDLRRMNPTFVHAVWNCLHDYDSITADSWLSDPKRAAKLQALCMRHKLLPTTATLAGGRVGLHPGITYLEHQETVRWLKRQLDKPFNGFTVVVTHHAPSFESLRQHGIKQDALTAEHWGVRDTEPAKIAGYASELLGSLSESHREAISLWVHGHTHSAMDYLEQGVRVLTNPRGRPFQKFPEGDLESLQARGYSVTPARLSEARRRERDDPFGGDGRNFEPALTIDLLTGQERPIDLALEPLRDKLDSLFQDLEELLPHTATGNSVPSRCVDAAFAERLASIEKLLDEAGTIAILPFDRYASHPSMSTLRGPQIPYLRTSWPAEEPLSREDYRHAVRQTVQALHWLDEAPQLMRKQLLLWGRTAALALKELHEAGHTATVAGLPLARIQDATRMELYLELDHAGEKEEGSWRRVNEKAASDVLERVLNGNRVPRLWIANFFIPDDLAGQELRSEDMAHFTPAEVAPC